MFGMGDKTAVGQEKRGFDNRRNYGFGGDHGNTFANMRKEKEQEEPKKKGRYAFHSDIQEVADILQSIYASGSSFSKQKTIDMTESEYRMLPIEMAKIVGKLFFYIFLIYISSFLITILCAKFKLSFGLSYPIPISIFFFSLLFYAWVVYGMQQFVIENEEQPKTKQVFKIVLSSWRFIEVSMFILMFVFIGIHFTEPIWIGNLTFLLEKIKFFFTPQDVSDSIDHLMYLSFMVNAIYVVFVYFTRRRFRKMQQKNMLAIYHQYDLHSAVDKKLDFEI
ncbi:hypothetical protein BKH46_08590 [Helicobacter sp. 12S02634-8]|uniref:hypothetical protein n=1 Tax=Helicobacter sp. 12S02634-8 TaxID=1476199 RepID=UPI000BA5207E|nr:hypothetical protein [Helicobacter sp. 12S02634-8]PAF46184.1 hypothetical protein BKH46_08590 [Helicobacter sp. 12S02634-8]